MPIPLIGKIEPKNGGAFPVVEDIHMEGGFRVVQDLTARDAIAVLNRKEGMYVYVVDDTAAYRLDGGIDNANWVDANFGGEGQFILHKNMPQSAGASVLYQGWVPFDCVLVAVRVFMNIPNTQGNYTLTIQNVNTATSVLAVSPFDMNTLAATDVHEIALSGTATDVEFATEGRFVVSLTSDNVLFDGEGIYFELHFQGGIPGSGGGATTTPTLAETLVEGNVTGGTDILMTPSDIISGFGDLGVAADVSIQGGTSTGGGAPTDGGDVVFTPGTGVDGGVDGEARVAGNLRLTGQLFGLAPRRFVFQPGGMAEGNVYTDFALLYTDLAAAGGYKELIFDTSVVTPATIPAGAYNFENTLLSDGDVRVGRSVDTHTMTFVVFATGALVSNATSFKNLRLAAPGSGTAPLQYLGGTTFLVSFDHCRLESAGTTTLLEVANASTLVRVDLFNSAIVDAGSEVIDVNDSGSITFIGQASSKLEPQTLLGDASALFGTVTRSASSAIEVDIAGGDHLAWLGALPTSVLDEDAAIRVTFDPSGLIAVTATNVQGAIEELDAAIGAGGVTSVNGDSGPVVLLTLDSILTEGNLTGGNNIILTVGDELRGADALGATGNPGEDLVLRAGTGDGVGDGGDIVFHPGTHGGGGVVGEARVVGDLNVTGKLTVAGSIDPTDVTFELSPVPPTGATQAAIFASDGTSGLNSGEIYMRKPSNGLLISLEAGGTSTGASLEITGLVCTVTEAVGDVVYISASNTVAQAQADSAVTTFISGFIVNKPTGTTCDVVIGGQVTGLSGLVAGTRYYLDEVTAGAIRSSPPSNPGDFISKIGTALNATTLLLQPDPPVLLT